MGKWAEWEWGGCEGMGAVRGWGLWTAGERRGERGSVRVGGMGDCMRMREVGLCGDGGDGEAMWEWGGPWGWGSCVGIGDCVGVEGLHGMRELWVN